MLLAIFSYYLFYFYIGFYWISFCIKFDLPIRPIHHLHLSPSASSSTSSCNRIDIHSLIDIYLNPMARCTQSYTMHTKAFIIEVGAVFSTTHPPPTPPPTLTEYFSRLDEITTIVNKRPCITTIQIRPLPDKSHCAPLYKDKHYCSRLCDMLLAYLSVCHSARVSRLIKLINWPLHDSLFDIQCVLLRMFFLYSKIEKL